MKALLPFFLGFTLATLIAILFRPTTHPVEDSAATATPNAVPFVVQCTETAHAKSPCTGEETWSSTFGTPDRKALPRLDYRFILVDEKPMRFEIGRKYVVQILDAAPPGKRQ